MGLWPAPARPELALFDERVAMPVPDACSPVEAGGFPEAFATAYDALFSQVGLTVGAGLADRGRRGVGMAGAQLAVAGGATVVASVRHGEVRAGVARLGTTSVAPDEAFALGPFDIVLELVGGPSVPEALAGSALVGRIVVIGVGGGEVPGWTLDCSCTEGRRCGPRLCVPARWRKRPSWPASSRTTSYLYSAAGKLRVVVETTYPFEKVAEAYERFETGHKFGKIVLTRT